MGNAGARELVENRQAVRFEPSLRALPKGRRGRKREKMRQEICRLAQEIDPKLVVLDADMDMHAADHEPAADLLKVFGEHVVAFFVGVLLARPFGERVGRGGDRSEAEFVSDAPDRTAEMDELVAGFLNRFADARADLDLRAEEFGAHLAAQRLLAFCEQLSRRLLGDVSARLVDEEIFFLDADREAWFLDGHGGAWWHNRGSGCSRYAMPPRITPTR